VSGVAKGNTAAINDILKNAKKKKESKAYDRSGRITEGPLTDEARDWAENNAQKEHREEREQKVNPIRRKELEKESPITRHNNTGPHYKYSSENENRLNADSDREYNVGLNLVTARNKLRGWYNKKKGK